MKYLVDTDWLIHYLKKHAIITAKLSEYQYEAIAVSIVSVAELYEGVYASPHPAHRMQAIDDLLQGLTILGIDRATATIFGRERRRLRTTGQLIGDCDLLIGATALQYELTLLTNNHSHFKRLDGLRIISL